MIDDTERELRDEAAARRAQGDQCCEMARDTARLIVAFREQLGESQMAAALADDLTREYALGLLDPRVLVDEEDED